VEEEYRRQLVGKPAKEDEDYFSLQMDDYSKEMKGDRDLRTGFAGSSGPLPNEEVQKAPLLSKAYLHVLGEYSRMALERDPRFGPVAMHSGTAEAGISYDWKRFEIRINGKTFKPSGRELDETTFELEIATLLGKECPAPLLEELKMLMSTNGRTAGFASGTNIETGLNLGTKDNTLHPRPEVVDISYEEGKFKLNYRTGGVYLKGMDIPTGEEFPLGVHLTFTKKDDNFFSNNRPEDIEGIPEVYGAYTYSLEPDLGESKSFRDRFEIERSLAAFGNFQNP
jgi:hypothetical protein